MTRMRARRALSAGTLVQRRYRVVEQLMDTPLLRRYQVEDHRAGDRRLLLLEYPLARRTRSRMERVVHMRRALSWLRHPGLCVPRTLFMDGHCIYFICSSGRGRTLRQRSEEGVTVYQVIRWVIQACDLVLQLHAAWPQPVILGRLGLASFKVSDEGLLQLVGFDLDENLHLGFSVDSDGPSWVAPETLPDTRSDVWCLGTLLKHLLSPDGPRPLASRATSSTLRRLIAEAVRREPAERTHTVMGLKTRLAELAHRLETRGQNSELTLLSPAETRAVRVATFRISLAMVLLAFLGSTLVLLQEQCHDYPVAPWVRIADLVHVPQGSLVWVEGTVEISPDMTSEPTSGLPAVAWCVAVERVIHREVLDRKTRVCTKKTFTETTMRDARSVPFVLADGNARVHVDGGALTSERGHPVYTWSLRDRLAPPRSVGSVSLPLTVRPGEMLEVIRVRLVRTAPGDSICVLAQVGRESGETILKAPAGLGDPRLLRGGRLRWTLGLLAFLSPTLAGVTIALGGLLLLGWQARRTSARKSRQVALVDEPRRGALG